jgi:hypothetical protein
LGLFRLFTYEHTAAELELLHKKRKSSGIISGDDYDLTNHIHHGVYKALNEFILKYNYELIYADDKTYNGSSNKIV